jgi:hypothetical protein
MRKIKRIQDTRTSFEFNVDDKVATNFYPINSQILINNNKHMSVFNDITQAGTSLNKGQVYLVINRWSDNDDRKGLAEGIHEYHSNNIPFHVNHWIAFSDSYDKQSLNNLIRHNPSYAVL